MPVVCVCACVCHFSVLPMLGLWSPCVRFCHGSPCFLLRAVSWKDNAPSERGHFKFFTSVWLPRCAGISVGHERRDIRRHRIHRSAPAPPRHRDSARVDFMRHSMPSCGSMEAAPKTPDLFLCPFSTGPFSLFHLKSLKMKLSSLKPTRPRQFLNSREGQTQQVTIVRQPPPQPRSRIRERLQFPSAFSGMKVQFWFQDIRNCGFLLFWRDQGIWIENLLRCESCFCIGVSILRPESHWRRCVASQHKFLLLVALNAQDPRPVFRPLRTWLVLFQDPTVRERRIL